MAFNPFEHHHHHDHDDDHEHDHDMLADPAQKSLADALRVSFAVLKLVMVILVILFFGSGVFVVDQGEVAIVTRFGDIVGTGEDRIVQPGKLHFALPYPIDQVIRIPTSVQQISLTETFWYAKDTETRSSQDLAGSMAQLNPLTIGSLITGDANIIHARFTINFEITDPVLFITNVADTTRTNKKFMTADAERLVRAAAEEGVVFAMAQVKADDMIRMQGTRFSVLAQPHAQTILDAMKSGIRITKLDMTKSSVPLHIERDYQVVTEAENQGATARLNAERQRQELLGGAAGEAHELLWNLIREYELATEARDTAAIARLDEQLRKAFTEQKLSKADGSIVAISGEAAAIISQAEADSSRIHSSALRDAENFNRLKAEYDVNPRIFLTRMWEATRERIMSHPDNEFFYVPPGQFRLFLNRSPEFLKEKERRDQKAAEEAKKGGAGGGGE
ncbi:MAG: SPFH domain-containing protein [Phycisphaeraceae bacterium]